MEYITHFDMAALVLYVVYLAIYFYQGHYPSRQAHIYLGMLTCGLISTAADLLTAYGNNHYGIIPPALLYFGNIVYIVFFDCIPFLYILYFAEVINTRITRVVSKVCAVPFVIGIILAVTTPFTHLVIYFDENGIYKHGPMFNYLYAVALAYVIIVVVFAIKYRRTLNKNKFDATIVYIVVNFVVVAAQFRYPEWLVSEFLLSIGIFLIYLTLQNPLTYIDGQTGLLNREAAMTIMRNKIRSGKGFYIIGVRVRGTSIVREHMGFDMVGRIRRQFADYFSRALKGNNTFYSQNNNLFSVIVPATDGAELRADSIVRRWCSNPILIDDMTLNLKVQTICVKFPQDVGSATEVSQIMDYWVREKRQTDRLEYCTEEFRELMNLEYDMRYIIDRAIEDNHIKVYFQPIYNVEKKRFTHAEALARLIDPEKGFIPPDTFISYAESSGQIIRLGRVILDKVFRLIRDERPEQYGVEKIQINISVVQCDQTHMAEDIIELMDKYGVRPDQIILEITETAALEQEIVVKENLRKLIDAGIEIAMDDYGTGFSNLMNLTTYAYKLIKLDKSLVWRAYEDAGASVLLTNSIDMFKRLSHGIVAEGVENEEHVKSLSELGVELLQGFYFSKPLDSEEYIKFMKEHSKDMLE